MYNISKDFVIWYAAHQAARFGTHRARVLSVSPGTFDTDMGRAAATHGAFDIAGLSALKRVGDPEEMGALLAFCAGPDASYLTGVDVLCDGGTVATAP